ncbi:MAG: hypothetical protein EA422_04875 [Gemmatimonadales bacterium]|nr:MAG: hypothetical protein EA422_04875 [Gemmatimonadales bacterium]
MSNTLLNPQLSILLEIQDMRAQLRELGSAEGSAPMEQEHFNIDLDEAKQHLEEKIGEMVGELSPQIRARYNRIAPNRDRVVVPVIHGVCYGCFVSIPTATAGDQGVHQVVRTCENCGSFIYVKP